MGAGRNLHVLSELSAFCEPWKNKSIAEGCNCLGIPRWDLGLYLTDCFTTYGVIRKATQNNPRAWKCTGHVAKRQLRSPRGQAGKQMARFGALLTRGL